MKSLARRIILYTAALASAFFINNLSVPSLDCAARMHVSDAKDKRIQQVCKTAESLEEIAMAKDGAKGETMFLLKAAHALSARHLELADGVYKYKSDASFFGLKSLTAEEAEAALEGKADCSFFSVYTYSNFSYLAERLKPELKKNVRLCTGLYRPYKGKYYGHTWLEVKVNDKWLPYETTWDMHKSSDKIQFSKLEKTMPDNFLLGNEEDYIRTYFVDESGGHIDFKNSAKWNAGILSRSISE